jgi:RHH-type rel operon transcriptional repressor/antitoxin RelB
MLYLYDIVLQTGELNMLAVRLPEKLDHKLGQLAKKTGRSKSYYVRRALEQFLQDHEDYLIAVARLEKKKTRLSLKEMERRLELED